MERIALRPALFMRLLTISTAKSPNLLVKVPQIRLRCHSSTAILVCKQPLNLPPPRITQLCRARCRPPLRSRKTATVFHRGHPPQPDRVTSLDLPPQDIRKCPTPAPTPLQHRTLNSDRWRRQPPRQPTQMTPYLQAIGSLRVSTVGRGSEKKSTVDSRCWCTARQSLQRRLDTTRPSRRKLIDGNY